MSKRVTKQVIQVAAREKRRLVGSAVGKNFLKTVTEPLTNSDSILKKQASLPHAAGLVNEIFKVAVGQRLDTSKLKPNIPRQKTRKVLLEITTSGPDSRLCRVIDTGTGMTSTELTAKFGCYAEAKAKGEKTRSLFGRGALDVLLYHEDSKIYSVSGGVLSLCKIYWSKDSTIEVEELGSATHALLGRHHLPSSIAKSGTVVEFRFRDGTSIPNEDQIIAKLSDFYMLRLIAADPNTEVLVERHRADGTHVDRLSHDFPMGIVLGQFSDTLNLGADGSLPIVAEHPKCTRQRTG